MNRPLRRPDSASDLTGRDERVSGPIAPEPRFVLALSSLNAVGDVGRQSDGIQAFLGFQILNLKVVVAFSAPGHSCAFRDCEFALG